MHKHGSSLILVLVVIASIMTIVLGTQRVLLVQFAQSNREEDSLFALYAAKAGIEDGLLRFRHTRDVETGLNKVFRMDLSAGQAVAGSLDHEVIAGSPISDIGATYRPSSQYYDLNIDFKSDRIGSFVSGGGATDSSPLLAKDTAFELTGFSSQQQPYYLRYAFKFIVPSGGNCDSALVQIQSVIPGQPLGQVTAAKQPGTVLYDSANSGHLAINAGAVPVASVRLRPYGCDVRMAFQTTSDSIGVGGTAGPRFDGLTNADGKFITKITATGYFGQAKRTLIGEIDRKSGQLIGIYDFNAYAGGNISR